MSTKEMIYAITFRIDTLRQANKLILKEGRINREYHENNARIAELEQLLEYVQLKQAA